MMTDKLEELRRLERYMESAICNQGEDTMTARALADLIELLRKEEEKLEAMRVKARAQLPALREQFEEDDDW